MTSRPPQDKEPKSSDSVIYRDYVEAKARRTPGAVSDVLLKHGVSRSTLSNIVRRVQHGNPGRIKNDMERARLAALWEHKYQARFCSLPKNRNAATVAQLRDIIRAMDADGFPNLRIAALLEKDRSTIIHHLEN